MSEPSVATLDPNTPVSVETDGKVLTGAGIEAADLQKTSDAHAALRGSVTPDDLPRDEKTGQFRPERPSRGAKRFEELSATAQAEKARADKAEAERESLRQELDAARRPAATREPTPVPTPVFGKPEPKFDDFVNAPDPIHAHAAAVAAWTLEKHEFDHPLAARIAEHLEADRASQRFDSRVRDAAAKGKEAYPDFEVVVAAQTEPIFNAAQIAAIFDADGSEHIQYALAKNVTEAKRIAHLDPIRFGMALAQLVPARPVVQAASTARPVAQTNAPPPIQPVGSGTRTTRPSLEELAASGNFADYQAARRASLAR